MTDIFAKAAELVARGEACVLVEVAEAKGSTPREVGAMMLVTPRGYHGTIGGGMLEWQAMAEAQKMLAHPSSIRTLTKSLGPDLGQCCGGRVTLRLQSLSAENLAELNFRAAEQGEVPTPLHLWGAGHVGRALVMALAPLPFAVTWWDMRPGAFPSVLPANVETRSGPPEVMHPPGLVLVMTHSHALDFAIVDYALRQTGFSQVGLIGSETKRARFMSRLRAAGHGEVALARLQCPIGDKTLNSKLPAVIAASVAVQALHWQQMLKTQIQSPLHMSLSAKG